jgi:hypothetical protein
MKWFYALLRAQNRTLPHRGRVLFSVGNRRLCGLTYGLVRLAKHAQSSINADAGVLRKGSRDFSICFTMHISL